MDNPAAKFLLSVLQPVYHLLVTLQCLDKHAVLYCLLEYTLYLTVTVAHATGQSSHLTNINLAYRDEER